MEKLASQTTSARTELWLENEHSKSQHKLQKCFESQSICANGICYIYILFIKYNLVHKTNPIFFSWCTIFLAPFKLASQRAAIVRGSHLTRRWARRRRVNQNNSYAHENAVISAKSAFSCRGEYDQSVWRSNALIERQDERHTTGIRINSIERFWWFQIIPNPTSISHYWIMCHEQNIRIVEYLWRFLEIFFVFLTEKPFQLCSVHFEAKKNADAFKWIGQTVHGLAHRNRTWNKEQVF